MKEFPEHEITPLIIDCAILSLDDIGEHVKAVSRYLLKTY
jgi:hypothetical protein